MSTNRRKSPETDGDRTRTGRETRRDEARLLRRNALLEAAIAEIRSIGPGATMEQLAKAGGVTKPILYRHFGDRDGLIAEIAQRFSTELLASVVGPLLSGTYPRQLLNASIDGYVAFVEKDPYLYGFLIQQVSSRGDHHSPISSLVDVVAKQIAIVIGEQLGAVGLDTGAAVPWAYGIVGLVHTATDWWLEDQTMSRDRFVQYLSDLLWDGLGGAGAPPQPAAGA